MNGPNCMYKLKLVIQFPDPLNLPNTMYHMKNIYRDPYSIKKGVDVTSTLPNILEQDHSPKIDLLKARQEKIIIQLNDLNDQMLSLNNQLQKKNSIQHVIPVQNLVHTSVGGVVEEVVVHANPDFPPYSLLAINQLWPEVLCVKVSCHTHSSIVSLPQNLSEFADLKNTTLPTLNIRLVWKNMGKDCELVISPLSICKLRGEVNLLRYLHRTIRSPSDPLTETKLDGLLDLCHSLVHSRTTRDKQLVLRALNARLGKSNWLNGDEISIADVAAWSALRNISGSDLSQNLSKWQSRFSKQVLSKKVQVHN